MQWKCSSDLTPCSCLIFKQYGYARHPALWSGIKEKLIDKTFVSLVGTQWRLAIQEIPSWAQMKILPSEDLGTNYLPQATF